MTEHNVFSNGFAIAIGVGNYNDKRLSVAETANDAKDFIKVLINPLCCAFKKENVIPAIVDKEANKENIVAQFQTLFEKTESDSNSTVLIYLAGHGVIERETNEYYFLPHETEVVWSDDDNIESIELRTAISNTELKGIFQKFSDSKSVKRLVIFLNTCHSGATGKNLSINHAATSQLRQIPNSVYLNLLKGSGKCIVAASREDQKSWIKNNERNSIFAKHLIAGLKGKAGKETDQTVTIQDLYHFLSSTVEKDAKTIDKVQVPIYAFYQGENFPIALKQGGSIPYSLKLHRFLVKYFNSDELKVIAMYFGADVSQYNSTDKFFLGNEIIAQSARSGKFRELVTTLIQMNPEQNYLMPEEKDIPESSDQTEKYLKFIQETKYRKIIISFYQEVENWILEKDILNPTTDANIKKFASIKTCEVLKSLNVVGKNEMIGFLYRYNLIGEKKPISLKGVDLKGVSLNFFDLTGIDLQGAKLNRANLSGTILEKANLTNAELKEAELTGVNFQNAKLNRADLYRANLGSSDLTKTDLSEAKLEKAFLGGIETIINQTNLNRADLKDADLRGATISNINLIGTKIEGTKIDSKWLLIWNLLNKKSSISDGDYKEISHANLSNANLEEVDFQKANLTDLNFSGSNLLKANFSYAEISGADFSNANLEEVDFQKANLTDLNFSESNLLKSNFSSAALKNIIFDNTKLININIINRIYNSIANLIKKILHGKSDLSFKDSILWGSDKADFSGAYIERCTFEGPRVSAKQLEKAKISNTTLPDGTKIGPIPYGAELQYVPPKEK